MYVTMYASCATAAETVSDTRKHLTGHVARFRAEGIEAEPVVFAHRRRPDAVLPPYETFVLLLDVAEDLVIAERIRERAASDWQADEEAGTPSFPILGGRRTPPSTRRSSHENGITR